MDDRLSDHDRDRLKKLAALRDQGILSPEEFRLARIRMQKAATAAAESPARIAIRAFLRRNWLIVASLGLLALLVIGVIVYGRIAASEDRLDPGYAETNVALPDVLDAGTTAGEALCSSEVTYRQVGDLVFNKAAQQIDGDRGPLDSLRRAVGPRMQYPLLRGVDERLRRTECSGHLIIDLPPAVRSQFGGVASLETDVEYSIQPSADGKGNVVEASGIDDMVGQLVGAAERLVPGSAPKPEGPSFECAGDVSPVEQIICHDDELAQLDRGIADRYQRLKNMLSPDLVLQLEDSQRSFLLRRDRCEVPACVRDAYIAHGRYLDQLGRTP